MCADTHGQKTIRKSGRRQKLPADAKLTRRHSRLRILIGVISAIKSLIKTVARTPIVASADGVGLRMTVSPIDPRTPSAAARLRLDSSKIANLSGAMIAEIWQIRTAPRVPIVPNVNGLGPRTTHSSGSPRMLHAVARLKRHQSQQLKANLQRLIAPAPKRPLQLVWTLRRRQLPKREGESA